jgi:hypothetical protein
MTTDKYTLNEAGEPVICSDLMEWAEWFGAKGRRSRFVAHTRLMGGWEVSTIFLGLDHNWLHEGPPVLWESMQFHFGHGEDGVRCSGTREQAEAMHAEMVRATRQLAANRDPVRDYAVALWYKLYRKWIWWSMIRRYTKKGKL